MKVTVVRGQLTKRKEPILLWLTQEASLPSWASGWSPTIKRAIGRLRKVKMFQGKAGEVFLLPLDSTFLVLVGLGKPQALTLDGVREAAASGAKLAAGSGMEKLAVGLPTLKKVQPHELAQAIVEGILLGTYRYRELKVKSLGEDEKRDLKSFTLVETGKNGTLFKKGVRRGELIAQAVCWARDMANRPPNCLTPKLMAQEAKAAAKKFRFRCQVLEPAAIRRLGMNALLGVARGSQEPARFIILEYKGKGHRQKRPLVFVGKGITFDSGGLSLKSSKGMEEMKFDMCGAAAVLGAFRAIAALKLPVHVVGLAPTTENLPGGSAQKPGDVVRTLTGKTVEVLNTDAEGRLVLADALGFAHRYKPEGMVDLATLTGACVVALGSQATGLMGNNAGMIQKVKEAAERSSERVWELPLWPEYAKAIRSNVADIQNIGDGKAGTITAAAFLKEFVGEIPWVHLDIAGVAWDSTKTYQPKGGTGVGVRLLVELASHWKAKK